MSAKSNAERLVSLSVMGNIAAPSMSPLPAMPYTISAEGESYLLPLNGSIVYNVAVGDAAFGWLADCPQPGVSISLKDVMGNVGLNMLACVGNTAIVQSGDANGARGVVTGKSGRFSDQVMIHFDRATLNKLVIGDKIVIQAHGTGLQLENHPDVHIKSCSPRLLDALEVSPTANGKLGVPVTATIPANLIGAGTGSTSEAGAIHLQTDDKDALREAGLNTLRIGDLVAISDYDSTWGNGYRRGAVTVGVISSGDSPRSGYGPGITVLMTSASGGIQPFATPNVNLKDILNL
jgi:hypothetical protein